MRLRTVSVLAIASAPAAVAIAQSLRERNIPHTQSEMHVRVISLYDFHPSQVSDADRKAKSREMDIFWGEMKATPDVTLPLLRTELLDLSDPSFFFTDGTELLLSLSKTKADKELAVSVLPRVHQVETQSAAYFFAVH